jgi:hypothetical protein
MKLLATLSIIVLTYWAVLVIQLFMIILKSPSI